MQWIEVWEQAAATADNERKANEKSQSSQQKVLKTDELWTSWETKIGHQKKKQIKVEGS